MTWRPPSENRENRMKTNWPRRTGKSIFYVTLQIHDLLERRADFQKQETRFWATLTMDGEGSRRHLFSGSLRALRTKQSEPEDSTCKIRIRYGLVSFSHVPLRERVHSRVAGACWRVPFRRHVSPPWPTLCQSVIHFFLRGTSAALFFGVCLSLLAFLREVGPPTQFELFELQFLKTRCTVVYRLPLAAGISYFERDQDI